MCVDADTSALTGDGRMNRNTDNERHSYGWVWVWGTLLVYMALEIARLA
jgi:hypothetical protein